MIRFSSPDIDTESLRQTMKEVARQHGLRLKVKESKAVTTTIDDLIDTQSPLVPLNITSQEHHPTDSTTPSTVGLPVHPETPTRSLLRPSTPPSVPLPVFNWR